MAGSDVNRRGGVQRVSSRGYSTYAATYYASLHIYVSRLCITVILLITDIAYHRALGKKRARAMRELLRIA